MYKRFLASFERTSGCKQGRRSHGGSGGSGPRCLNSARAVRVQLVAPFCDNKRIKAITNKLSLTYRHMYKYIL